MLIRLSAGAAYDIYYFLTVFRLIVCDILLFLIPASPPSMKPKVAMRLISTADLTLCSFPDECMPKYTILSHTWKPEQEVLYQEVLNPTDEIRSRAGYLKIQCCAEISRSLGFEYTWVDTCCIDKNNPAELSESINSMYKWYQESGVFIAYLQDFNGESIDEVTSCNTWFTRGWTLQELIGPKQVLFYSTSWQKIGEKTRDAKKLEEITSIDRTVLISRRLEDVSVAEKMKWIAARRTTQREDKSYCMLGIFGVNMPLLYGEGGDNAFRRLQEEIMRTLDDVTIFLWKENDTGRFSLRGALAHSAKDFENSEASKTPLRTLSEPFSVTNKGIRVTAKLHKLDESFCDGKEELSNDYIRGDFRRGNLFGLHLDPRKQSSNSSSIILLRRLQPNGTQYCRAYPGLVFPAENPVRSNKSNQSFFITDTVTNATNIVCKDFAVTLREFSLEPEVQALHSHPNPYGIKAAFLSNEFPSLGQGYDGCLVLDYYAPDSLLRLSFFDGAVLAGNIPGDVGFERFRELVKGGNNGQFNIRKFSFRLTAQTQARYKIRDKVLDFSLSQKITKEGLLLKVDISVPEDSH